MGALGGLLPDADVLIRSPSDPLLTLEYHRHFTHALAFVPVGGALTAALGRLISRGKHQARDLFLPATLGWATHGLLDTCTSYGTYLLWPFSSARLAWHNISIVDPLLTLPLLLGVMLAATRRNRRLGQVALGWAVAVLLFGVVQRERAEQVYREFIASRGHDPAIVEVKPSLGNNILFRGFYAHDGSYWADAVRVPWWGEARVYQGAQAPTLDWERVTEGLDPLHVRDLERFAYFSNGYLIHDPIELGMIADFRYAILPNSVAPMWGVYLGGAKPGEHLQFRRYTKTTPPVRAAFMDQLLGRP